MGRTGKPDERLCQAIGALVHQQFITFAMYIQDLYLRIIPEVLAQFAQKYVHTAAIKVIVVMPDAQQGFLAGKHTVFLQTQQA